MLLAYLKLPTWFLLTIRKAVSRILSIKFPITNSAFAIAHCSRGDLRSSRDLAFWYLKVGVLDDVFSFVLSAALKLLHNARRGRSTSGFCPLPA